MNAYLILFLAFVIFGIAYLFVVLFPLAGILTGGFKILQKKRLENEAYGVVNYHKKLGYTMADGGKKEKDD